MKNLIPSKDNSIEPRGAIGKQIFGIIFWQKSRFLKYCTNCKFQQIILLIEQKYSPTKIQNVGNTCYLQFYNDDEKVLFLTIKKKPFRSFLYGESCTAYTDPNFHIFVLDIMNYISNEIDCVFFVDDATGYLEHRSVEELKKYIDNLEIVVPESPDLLREAIIKNKMQKKGSD